MEILITASLLAAFIAGMAALFAPCCITVLLPAYLGSIFRQKRTIFLMTFIFFLGLLLVFLPLGLGIAGIGQIFSQYHDAIFIIGGIFLLSLGAFILLGRHFSLPFAPRPKVRVQSAGSVFILGVFSAFATLCCAPVLAGVLALSILPGSIFWGGIYTLAYVLGMVIPLFFIAYFLDKADFTKKFWAFKKPISYKLAGKKIELRVADIISGATFVFMGVLILYLAQTSQIATHSSYQTMVNIYMSNLTDGINAYAGWIPWQAWVALIAAVFGFIIWRAIYVQKTSKE
ncbi:MAG: cytochrome c biogenesis protein CcdA [Candidatus Aenigmatarchaeota archaeon]